MTTESTMSEMFELIQKMWNPLNIPLPSLLTPTLDPAEIERKITELKAVEGWLSMNLKMLQVTIQTLEMQKSGLQAISASADAVRTSAQAVRSSAEAMQAAASGTSQS
ncbi:MAG: PhaM family polyhydroxyalkanoate granule multifunctional regulatory protein [Burkholderiales bacterium]